MDKNSLYVEILEALGDDRKLDHSAVGGQRLTITSLLPAEVGAPTVADQLRHLLLCTVTYEFKSGKCWMVSRRYGSQSSSSTPVGTRRWLKD